MKRMDDIDKLRIEDIIKLPFFFSLVKLVPDAKLFQTTVIWSITFRCNKVSPDGKYQLLDLISDTEYVTRYKLIEFE